MRTNALTYEIGVLIEFTNEDLELLRACAVAHYDGPVKASAKQGGFIYGWINKQTIPGLGCRCSSEELDTCAKALEQPSQANEAERQMGARLNLRNAITGALRHLNKKTAALTELLRQC